MPVHCCVEKLNELRNTLRQHFCTKATRRLFLDSYTNGRALSYNTRYRKVRNISLKKNFNEKAKFKVRRRVCGDGREDSACIRGRHLLSKIRGCNQ